MDLRENLDIAATAQKLPEEMKTPIVNLIDTKINSDMKEVISEIKNLQVKMESDRVSIRSEFRILYWVIGTVGISLFATLMGMILK